MQIEPGIPFSTFIAGVALAFLCLAAVIIIIQGVVEQLIFKSSSSNIWLDFISFILVLKTLNLAVSIYIRIVIMISILLLLIYWSRIMNWFSSRGAEQLSDGMIEGYRRAIASDPRNLAAREKLVDELRKRGMLEEAIHEQQELLEIEPNDRVAQKKLGWLIEDREEGIRGVTICPTCGFRNYGDLDQCRNCSEELRIKNYIKSRIARGGTKRLVGAIGTLLAIVILIAVLCSWLGPYGLLTVELVVIAVSMFVIFVFFYLKV